MKIIFAHFSIAKYGGIISYMKSMIMACKELGHEIDIVELSSSSTNQKSYEKRIKEFETGEFQKKIKHNSQSGGYEYDKASGYWENHYYGWFLPPSNRIGVYEEDSVERWQSITKNCDLIMWNFMPTKSSDWQADKKDFSFWWKFFDLPSYRTKQIFLVHDAYFNVRASNISALKDKILFLGCAHLAAYKCCSEIGIPAELLLNPRYIDDGAEMPIIPKSKRKTDFFAAHIFKSMKHMEDLISSIPYINESGNCYSVKIAGSGIEMNYMTSETKVKPVYICNVKKDPDLPLKLDKKVTLWNRAEEFGMEYLGQISGEEVKKNLLNSKFAIDPSWAKHYAQYCRTHINGFIIEAMLNGCYPVIRDYKGLSKIEDNLYDPLFENIRAIVIPWDSTPKQFADFIKKANEMPDEKYLRDTKHNFEIVRELFNAKINMIEIINLVKGGEKLVNGKLACGEDSETVLKVTKDIMEDFYHINLPIEWEFE